MVEWLSKKFAQEAKSDSDRDLIAEHGVAVYRELWAEIEKVLADGTVKNRFAPTTNGAVGHFKVILEDRSTLHVDLIRAIGEEGIEASGDGVAVRFQFGVDKKNVVHLTHEGKQISAERGAQLVMEPFLFS